MEIQRSKEWFLKRKGKITGSSAGAILGMCPFRKPKDVMRSMVREANGAESEFNGNIATEYGNKFESFAEKDFEMETGLDVEETGFHISEEYPWIGASPDGLVSDGAVLEIKCPFSKRDGGEFKTALLQPQYYAQMQFEMLVTGRKKCHFYQWSTINSSLETVEYSQAWFDNSLPKLKAFYDSYLEELKSPEKHLAPLVQTMVSVQLAEAYNNTKDSIAQLKVKLDSLREQLISCADGKKSNVSGLLVYPIERKGSVQYKNIPELKDVDLDQYRGKPTKSWGVR